MALALAFFVSAAARSEDAPPGKSKGYCLFARDMIRISILGEPDLSVERRIDGNGQVSLPLIGLVGVQGLSVTAAEEKIRATYIEREFLIRPQVAVTVTEYLPREISVLGQVNNPGKVVFPIEAGSISVVEAISKAGGFTRIAKADSVRITRRGESGSEASSSVNVEGMIDGKGKIAVFLLLPGDVVYVPERVF